ncbi:MAG: pyridoxal-phosphate dependent enzyme [Flavobacteriaceae bacterium]|nr:pyridoxal-phosphate dependent enzyme [Flavobacteriaceae bacterium]MDG1911854.1 pyridoxal-phosphate dependent enzyme [Flavobacteriaceae bacterium]
MQLFESFKSSINQSLEPIEGHTIVIKREDLIHPVVSGNKFRKLKYVFKALEEQSHSTILTFGGAFSNHLAAVAAAGKLENIQTIGIVRGEEWQNKLDTSTTLSYCQRQGMTLYCVSRADYDLKETSALVCDLQKHNSSIRLLAEGGTEALAVKGCQEILEKGDEEFDVICSSVGTGGTLAGLINKSSPNQTVVGFNALRNPEVINQIAHFTKKNNWYIEDQYAFGGYAKVNEELISFMNAFYQQYKIPLDPIYTGKLLFGIFDLIKQKKWPWGKKILIIHTGGLQGVKGMNLQLQKKGNPQLIYGNDLPF